ncbi:WYL domain-containing protein [Candidatus Enterococcus ferrettii]|uniref:WYL domain-containing protein n=1 Tax=Candidatus Enterococcus ferrettii TaxID=2815324 RepID=A0ABV0EMR5_9ENTE|nr:WYL domain-containing protein [Enterococcus sp. 665A]MBO1338957.1 WYL domain-containing protein [Enterococcus sp. 665A]
MELFSEIHSLYYQLMAQLLQTKTADEQRELLEQNGFKETPFEMSAYLTEDKEGWHLTKDKHTILKHSPKSFPLTKLEKAWLAAIQQEQKFSCFSDPFDLEECEPLFSWQDIHYFDQFVSEDSFTGAYAQIVRKLLQSIDEQQVMQLDYQAAGKQQATRHLFQPLKLEYSAKNNKFRVLGKRKNGRSWKTVTFNCSDIQSLEPAKDSSIEGMVWSPPRLCKIVCHLIDERSALERATFHFSNYRKTVERLGDNQYRLTVFYEKKDETELLINVLSFGARMKVVEPDHFVQLIKERLIRQKELSHL